MAARRSSAAPAAVITLTTDFGTQDAFVGIMKGVILRAAPSARIVDLTHGIPPQNVVAGAYALASAIRFFPPGTIHVAVVDPGVGTRRRALAVESEDGWLIGPDNGLLSLAAPARSVRRILDVSQSRVRLRPVSRTFHGRDLFAPVAAALAAGADPTRLGRPTHTMERLHTRNARRRGSALVGEVLFADGFGNLATNVTRADLERAAFRGRGLSITIAGHVVPFRTSYAGVAVGRPVALLNSSDLVEIAVNRGSAARLLGVESGAPVTVESA